MVGAYPRWGKRVVDLFGSAILLAAVTPLLLLCAVLVWLEDRRPPWFAQQRVGRHHQCFRLLKLRTMPAGTPERASADARNLQVTRVGRWIRRLNVDELPQLVNVLRGEMSLVGPRPALPSQTVLLALRTANGAAALRPGLTGAAQVHAYDGMTETEKATWDGWYATRVHLSTDLMLVLRTVTYLTRRPPVY